MMDFRDEAKDDRSRAVAGFEILDTPPERGFDDIVELAAVICGAPAALLSFADGSRLWFKARVGVPQGEADLDDSVCAHALDEPDLLVIPDLAADPRTTRSWMVMAEPPFRFYAGAPLRTAAGQEMGTLCVVDGSPRPEGLTAAQATVLRNLARQVINLLAMRRAIIGRDSFIAQRRQVEERLGASAARLRISEAHWRGLFERLDEGFVIAELVRDGEGRAIDWRYLDVNAAWGVLMGVDPTGVIGRTVREVLPGIEDEWIRDFAGVVETGEPLAFTRPVAGMNRWYEGRAFALDEDRFAVLFQEVTDRIRSETRRDALLEIGDQLRDIRTVGEMTGMAARIVGEALGLTRVGFGRLDADTESLVVELDWSAPGVSGLAGRHRLADWGDLGRELVRGEPFVVGDVGADPRLHADRDRWEDADVRALVGIPVRERGRTVALLVTHDDEPRVWEPETLSFLRNVADRLAAAVARVTAENQQLLLNQELSHRMKNMLAMIQAIANQTLKRVTEQDAVDGFQQRLLALASAHDVLLQTSWTAAPMREVVDGVLGALGASGRFVADGAGIMLGPRATLSTSLLLHELATNAAKYGALSVPAGRVTVGWHVDDGTREMVFTWKEAGGPPVAEPTRKGFGSRLIGSGLIGTGSVSLRYRHSGLEVEMRAGLEQVQTT